MAQYNYSTKVEENMAKAVGRNLAISRKHAIEIALQIRGRSVEYAKRILSDANSGKRAIKVSRYTEGAGHRAGLGPGKFFKNATSEILKLVDSVVANAQMKGLATGKLVICHISAQKGAPIFRRGRHSRRKMKQCHVEIVVREKLEKQKTGNAKK